MWFCAWTDLLQPMLSCWWRCLSYWLPVITVELRLRLVSGQAELTSLIWARLVLRA